MIKTEARISIHRDEIGGQIFAAHIPFNSEVYGAQELIREIVVQVAARYVAENYPALVAKLDQQAIANLVVAESGKKIAEEIRLTTTVIEKTNREVYQRGVFGGLTRIR